VCFENAFDRKQFQKAVRIRTHRNAGKIPEKTLLGEKRREKIFGESDREKRVENQARKLRVALAWRDSD